MKYALFLHSLLSSVQLYAYEKERLFSNPFEYPDIGLPEGEEVLIGFIIAIIAIPIGYLIVSNAKDGSPAGCLGMIFFGIGVISLFPLFAWLFSLAGLIWGIGILFSIIIIVVVLIYNVLKKK